MLFLNNLIFNKVFDNQDKIFFRDLWLAVVPPSGGSTDQAPTKSGCLGFFYSITKLPGLPTSLNEGDYVGRSPTVSDFSANWRRSLKVTDNAAKRGKNWKAHPVTFGISCFLGGLCLRDVPDSRRDVLYNFYIHSLLINNSI